MDSIRNNHREREPLSRIRLQEGIILLLSRWYALQMAIKNQWGGCDSIQKSHQLASHLFSWLSKSNAPICVEDLENQLHESMLLTFNTEIEDGSIEQGGPQFDPPQLRLEGDWNHLMPELTPEPDSTGGENK